LDEIFEEIPRVRKDLRYISLVTPTSQIIVVQATLNVITGGRYKIITNETKELLKGGYGETPGLVNMELQKKALEDEQPIDCRPADLIPKAMDRLRNELKGVRCDRLGRGYLDLCPFPQYRIGFFQKS
jgi:pyruvate/oxaloacetate carboxyltransferase